MSVKETKSVNHVTLFKSYVTLMAAHGRKFEMRANLQIKIHKSKEELEAIIAAL